MTSVVTPWLSSCSLRPAQVVVAGQVVAAHGRAGGGGDRQSRLELAGQVGAAAREGRGPVHRLDLVGAAPQVVAGLGQLVTSPAPGRAVLVGGQVVGPPAAVLQRLRAAVHPILAQVEVVRQDAARLRQLEEDVVPGAGPESPGPGRGPRDRYAPGPRLIGCDVKEQCPRWTTGRTQAGSARCRPPEGDDRRASRGQAPRPFYALGPGPSSQPGFRAHPAGRCPRCDGRSLRRADRSASRRAPCKGGHLQVSGSAPGIA